MKNKTFQTKALNQTLQMRKATWLIPVFFFILYPIMFWDTVKTAFQESNFMSALIVIILIALLFSIVLSVIPFFIARGIINTKREKLIQESSFITVHDFEYYRDKLKGLSPATISLLTDLEIEQRKDVIASILQYKNWGIIKSDQFGKYHLTEKYDSCTQLRASDKYLIKGLVDGTFRMDTDTKWKEMVKQEAMAEGYISDGVQLFQKGKMRKGKQVLLLCGVICFAIFLLRHEAILSVLERAPENQTAGEQLVYIAQHPEIIPFAILIMGAFIFMMGLLIYPFSRVFSSINAANTQKKIKRTDDGNIMAECVYGMKNFIHDFSNLSQAHKEQVVLWEDYLVYAVVLEENQKIVDEITALRERQESE